MRKSGPEPSHPEVVENWVDGRVYSGEQDPGHDPRVPEHEAGVEERVWVLVRVIPKHYRLQDDEDDVRDVTDQEESGEHGDGDSCVEVVLLGQDGAVCCRVEEFYQTHEETNKRDNGG